MSTYETVTISEPAPNGNGYIPIPKRFMDAEIFRAFTDYLPRLYYNEFVESTTLYLLDPATHGDYTPFKENSDALTTVVESPPHIEETHALELPYHLTESTALPGTRVEWGFETDTPVIKLSTDPDPDPIAATGPGINTIGHIDDSTVFAVNGTFQDVSNKALSEAGIVARNHVQETTSDTGIVTGHQLVLPNNISPFDGGESFTWTATPVNVESRVRITPECVTSERRNTGLTTTQTRSETKFPIPNAVSNVFDLPQPTGVIWVLNDSGIHAIV